MSGSRRRQKRHARDAGPGRIDILTALTGLTFVEAWPDRVRRSFGEVDVDFIGRQAFLRNKRATGRPKDLGDIEGME